MKNKSIPFKEALLLAVGEAIVSAIVVGIFLLIKKFDFAVLRGTLLGSLIIVLNYLFFSISVNRAIDRALEYAPKAAEKDSFSSRDIVIDGAQNEAEPQGGEAASPTVTAADGADNAECAAGEAECTEGAQVCVADNAEDVAGEAEEVAGEEVDAAAAFAQQYAMSVQNTVKISYIIRTVTMLISLVVAFILPGVFNVIATLVPLLMFRPLLILESFIRNKKL